MEEAIEADMNRTRKFSPFLRDNISSSSVLIKKIAEF